MIYESIIEGSKSSFNKENVCDLEIQLHLSMHAEEMETNALKVIHSSRVCHASQENKLFY